MERLRELGCCSLVAPPVCNRPAQAPRAAGSWKQVSSNSHRVLTSRAPAAQSEAQILGNRNPQHEFPADLLLQQRQHHVAQLEQRFDGIYQDVLAE